MGTRRGPARSAQPLIAFAGGAIGGATTMIVLWRLLWRRERWY